MKIGENGKEERGEGERKTFKRRGRECMKMGMKEQIEDEEEEEESGKLGKKVERVNQEGLEYTERKEGTGENERNSVKKIKRRSLCA